VRRSLSVVAAVLLVGATAAPAGAHARTTIRLAAPAEAARLTGGTVRVVLVGEGGDSASAFALDLDGKAVDARGQVGGIFSTLSVRPNEQLVLDVSVALGDHVLTVRPNADVDAPLPAIERRFSVVENEAGGGAAPLVLAGVAVLGALGAVVAVRRKAAAEAATDLAATD
jgi:hypothetical protein